MQLSPPLKIAWQRKLSECPLTSATASDGRIVLASPDTHTAHCLDAQTGEQRWKYIAGGRIDTPPTIHRGHVFFGGRDGVLYALDLDSGDLAWQLNLFPDAPRIHAFGQLESAQPVHGSMLVKDEFVYVLSGRSSFLDGGLHLFKIRAADGKIMASRVLAGELQDGGKAVNAMLPDLLTAGEKGFYIRNARFRYEDLSDVRGTGDHLWSPNGLLDDSWLHRVYWVYGTEWGRTWPQQVPRLPVPAGRLLCVDTEAGIVYGFGRNKYGWGISPDRWQSGEKYYQVHATPIESSDNQDDQTNWRRGTSLPHKALWSVRSDIEARAMAVTGNHVLIAGPKGKTVFSEAAFRGEEGVALQILDKDTGNAVQEISLPAIPTFDGLIAALDHVYVSLEDGNIVCVKPDPVQQGY
jgi:outer membrane protein assembly factor BamB